MVLEAVPCPACDSTDVVKHGKTAAGKQRYKCRNPRCQRHSFILDYSYRGYLPQVKQQIGDMAVNGSGIRDTAREILGGIIPPETLSRVLKISPTTVIEELKKDRYLEQVNIPLLQQLQPTAIDVVQYVEEAEPDEMWSFVGNKKQQRWLWHGIDHQTGQILAYVLAAEHKDEAFIQKEVFGRNYSPRNFRLKALLEPFGIQQFYTDGWGAYQRYLEQEQHVVGKSNTQKIERKHLTLPTRIKRLARKTICFSKSIWLHDVVVGLFINRFEFGRTV